MTKTTILFALVACFSCGFVLAGETITAQEVEGYFYADGKMTRSEAQFEITYYMDENTVTRTRVFDLNKKQVIPDNTVYQIQRQLTSDPTNGLPLGGKSVIRAFGQPGTDAMEILIIDEIFVQYVKSTSNYLVISRLKRIK